MSTPLYDPTYATTAPARLTESLSKPVVTALVKALANRLQALENAAFQVLYSGLLGSVQVLFPAVAPDPTTGLVNTAFAPIGQVVLDGNGYSLDQLGSLLNQPRNGLQDYDYLTVLKCAILVVKSKGRTIDIEDILQAATPQGGSWTFTPFQPIGFTAGVYGPSSVVPLPAALKKAAPAGVPVIYEANAVAVTGSEFWADSTSNLVTPGISVWGDSVSPPGPGGYWSSSIRL